MYNHSTKGNHYAHYYFFSKSEQHKYVSRHLLTSSICPFIYGSPIIHQTSSVQVTIKYKWKRRIYPRIFSEHMKSIMIFWLFLLYFVMLHPPFKASWIKYWSHIFEPLSFFSLMTYWSIVKLGRPIYNMYLKFWKSFKTITCLLKNSKCSFRVLSWNT